jgi:hypothetical protein
MAGPFVLLPEIKYDGPVRGAIFDKAEARILSWSDDQTVRLWDAATGAPPSLGRRDRRAARCPDDA